MAKKKIVMTEGKRNIIASLLQEYDIKSAKDIQEALKELLGGTIQNMLETELDNHLGYESYERSDNTNSRNGTNLNPSEVHTEKWKSTFHKTEIVHLNHRL